MTSPLLTDLYQLTMAYGYWKLGMHEREAVFHHTFRTHPFHGGYAVACGLATVTEFLQQWQFHEDELSYLGTLKSPGGTPLFSKTFLNYLSELHFTCDVDAVPEGTPVFANEPLIRIRGPLIQAQLLESAILNMINFQTLIATKASRVCQAAQGDPVLEFGLRRAQGADGALSASRAAYIGGCTATSNTLAGKLYDIPVRGTHAHSWVTAFHDEWHAFEALAEVMPHNCILLVDTYNTLNGVNHAIQIGQLLRSKGHDLLGIRLDSGDLTRLSCQARKLLDAAGFEKTKIIASNNLDECVIQKIKAQGGKIDHWGVGTHLVTAYDHPALDGVYKLSALRGSSGHWEYKLKLSEDIEKNSTPGVCAIRRFFKNKTPIMDMIYDTELGISDVPNRVFLDNGNKEIIISACDYDNALDLLIPVFRRGQRVFSAESIHALRERTIQQVPMFSEFHSKKSYPAGLEKNIYNLKKQLISDIQKYDRT